ncbi:MAG: hypothetical protein U1E46_15085 [Hyphomicrobiales bacterium]
MKLRTLITVASLVAFSGSAFAATEYYIVRDAKTGKCEISEKKPDGKAMVQIHHQQFTSKAEAEKVLKSDDKTMAQCKKS